MQRQEIQWEKSPQDKENSVTNPLNTDQVGHGD